MGGVIMFKTIAKALTVVVLIALLSGCNLGEMMIHENESPYDFDKTVEVITANAKAHGWIVPKVYDFQKSLLKYKQPDPGKVKALKICHPEYASQLLSQDDSKFVAAMMPCSIAVYEKSDGKVYVSSMNMGLMSKMFGGVVGDTLAKVARVRFLVFLRNK
jgi:uncharacterized protein (DUF302 family)